jgi:hypothetical protein
VAYINSKELRQAWNKRLQAVLGGDTFWAALEIKTTKKYFRKMKKVL